MSDRFVVDPPQLDLLLKQLRLPTMRALWRSFTERADREGWPTARLLAALASHEVTDRERRRFERHRAEAKLPPGKTLDNFDFTLVPPASKARVRVLASGDVWLGEGANVLLFGPPGTGKIHLAAALGLALAENGSGSSTSARRRWCRRSRRHAGTSRSKPPSARSTSTTS